MIIPYFCRSKLIDGKIINETVIGLAFALSQGKLGLGVCKEQASKDNCFINYRQTTK